MAPTTTAPNKEHHTPTKENRTPTKQLPVRMPEDLYNALKGTAYFTERSMNDVVVAALTAYLLDTSRQETLDAIVERARSEYRCALDKLADL